jgi:tetratricopeptide (TPR) repeat protein
VHFERGEMDEYITHYREAYALTGNMRYYKNVASGLADAGRLDDLASFAAEGPDVPEGWHMLGTAYIEAGKWEDALEAIGKAADADSAYHGIHTLMGQAYAMTGRYNEALAAFREAVARNEGAKDGTRHLLFNNIGTIHAMREQYTEAIGQFLLAVREKPDFAQGHFSIAKMYAATGNDSLASKHARMAERYGHDKKAVMEVLGMVGGEQ